MADNGAADTFEQLRDDIAGLQEQVKELMRTASDTGSHGFSAAREKAAETARRLADLASARSEQSLELVSDYVQRHPVASILGAAFLGALLSRSFRR